MAVSKDFNTLGDILLRRYTENFVRDLQNGVGIMTGLVQDNSIDLEKVLKEAEKVSFEDLLK
jgi:hypothetical protein